MSRFNSNTRKRQSNKTINRAGGEAFELTPKLKFASLLLTSFLKDKFYSGIGDQLDRISYMVQQINDSFVGKTAVLTRNEFGMRTITHVAAGEIARHCKGVEWTRPFFKNVIYRPDDATEIVAYYLSRYGKPLPNALKDGIGQALTKFDEYQLAKYRQANSDVSLVDVVNLTHPPHTEAISKLVDDELRQHGTWEDKKSEGKSTEQVFGELLSEGKLGYFALLRNLRNILETGSGGLVEMAVEQLTDEDRIRKSLVLPFRYQKALKAISKESYPHQRKVMDAIGEAADTAVSNVPDLGENTLIVVDVSGSMYGGLMNSEQVIDQASLFAAALYKRSNADMMMFSGDAGYYQPLSSDNVLTIAQKIRDDGGGGTTNFHAPFKRMNRHYDKLIFLSDMQGWVGRNHPGSSMQEYESAYGEIRSLWTFDLTGYGTSQFPTDKIRIISGFSEKVLDIMKELDDNPDALLSRIEDVEL